jgi:hypothetical protein
MARFSRGRKTEPLTGWAVALFHLVLALCWAGNIQARNPKSEIRNKSEFPKVQMFKTEASREKVQGPMAREKPLWRVSRVWRATSKALNPNIEIRNKSELPKVRMFKTEASREKVQGPMAREKPLWRVSRVRVFGGQHPSSKSEYRNPKQIRISQGSKVQNRSEQGKGPRANGSGKTSLACSAYLAGNIQGSKSEYRNPKQIRIAQGSNVQNRSEQ